MQTRKHTSGPWAVTGAPGRLSIHNADNGNSVATIAYLDAEAKANAALIAAAPDLLALLVESKKIILSMGEVTPGSAAHSFLIDCRETIAKAQGRAQ